MAGGMDIGNPLDTRNETLAQQQVQWGLDHVHARLLALAGDAGDDAPVGEPPGLDAPALAHPQLQRLCRAFALDAFEAQVLLLALGAEALPEIGALCERCHGRDGWNFATFRLALSLFPGGDWRALTPIGPLRRWDLIGLEDGPNLLDGRVTLKEFTLHWLCGVPCRLRPLSDVMEALPPHDDPDLPASHAAIAERIALAVDIAERRGMPAPRIQFCCPEPADAAAIARAAGSRLGRSLDRLLPEAALSRSPDRAIVIRMIQREQKLAHGLLLLELADQDLAGDRMADLASFLAEVPAPVIVCTPARLLMPGVHWMTCKVDPPTRQEQAALWRGLLGEEAEAQADMLSRFDMRRAAIETAFRDADVARRAAGDERRPASLRAHLGEACRAQMRGALDRFALRLETRASLEDLVLPPAQSNQLQAIATDMKNQSKALELWESGGASKRGLGMCALFTGPSGSGKTTAAEALARMLDLDLYRIDLSAVVSKYIGETEKQLDRLFDAAEGGASLLLFDESDALFGKRTEVRDSHDRYANQEISFLLQKLETYKGLAVLTSNRPDALDGAFLRRFRYVVEFPLPGLNEREEIWRRVFGKAVPTLALDPVKLARLALTGGHIRNIALQALFLATAEGGAVTMDLIYRAARQEYRKLHRSPTDDEIED